MLFLGSTFGPLVFDPLSKLGTARNIHPGIDQQRGYGAAFAVATGLHATVFVVAYCCIPETLSGAILSVEEGCPSPLSPRPPAPSPSGIGGLLLPHPILIPGDKIQALGQGEGLLGGRETLVGEEEEEEGAGREGEGWGCLTPTGGPSLLSGGASPVWRPEREEIVVAEREECRGGPSHRFYRHFRLARANLAQALRVLTRSRLLVVLSCAFCLHYGSTVAFPQVWTLYAKHRLRWQDGTVTNFFSMRSATNLVGITLLAFVVHRYERGKRHDLIAVMCGLLFTGAASLLYVIVPPEPVWWVFIVTPLSGVGTIVAPCVKAAISKTVAQQEQGAAFAAISALQTVMGVTAPALFSAIYAVTVASFAGATFVTMAGLLGGMGVLCFPLLLARAPQ